MEPQITFLAMGDNVWMYFTKLLWSIDIEKPILLSSNDLVSFTLWKLSLLLIKEILKWFITPWRRSFIYAGVDLCLIWYFSKFMRNYRKTDMADEPSQAREQTVRDMDSRTRTSRTESFTNTNGPNRNFLHDPRTSRIECFMNTSRIELIVFAKRNAQIYDPPAI
jgi:hypothetical protein